MKEIQICIGSACHVKGSYDVVSCFKKLVEEQGLEDEVHLQGAFCMNACGDGVAVKYNDQIVTVKPEGVPALFEKIMEAE
ncbi:MAG: (2Fe-2S) ferredoxin domain-containing protein [Eubacteriaceae bacterium]|jgi:NADH:ubiquinone oxidoreductase subunit E|nr:(2Fe-2S) ferredoxin domain-containing protein [Eubacteriaceae bacterium]MDD4507735.1 (2Fe-2S) ferredoxin domain-containing protein [Eubacteriaceae bacterium]